MSHEHFREPPDPALLTAAQWRAMRAFVLLGAIATVAGGLTAAITRPAGVAAGAWVAAYLVLVAGVAQVGLGLGQALLAGGVPSLGYRRWELALFNLGNLGVLVGTVAEIVALVMAGGVILLVSLLLFFAAVRRSRGHRRYLIMYRLLTALIAVSIPIGLTMSVLRHG